MVSDEWLSGGCLSKAHTDGEHDGVGLVIDDVLEFFKEHQTAHDGSTDPKALKKTHH